MEDVELLDMFVQNPSQFRRVAPVLESNSPVLEAISRAQFWGDLIGKPILQVGNGHIGAGGL